MNEGNIKRKIGLLTEYNRQLLPYICFFILLINQQLIRANYLPECNIFFSDIFIIYWYNDALLSKHYTHHEYIHV